MSEEQIKELEEELASLNALRERQFAGRRLMPLEDSIAINEQTLYLQRKIAAFRGEEYAEELESDIPTSLGISAPVGFEWYAIGGFGLDAILICELVKEHGTVFITFSQTMDMTMGGLNDEVFEGHRLYGKGLGVAGVFIVRNSRWLEETRSGMKLHSCYDAELLKNMKHYLFRTKGGEFACLATGFKVSKKQRSILEVRAAISDLVNSPEAKL